MRNSFVKWFLYNFILLILVAGIYIIVTNRIDPAETMHELAGRIANLVIPGIGTYIIARLVVDTWGKKLTFLVAPTAAFFYTYVLILIVNRKDQLELPTEFLFTLTVSVSLVYGLVIAAVKFRNEPSILSSWQLLQSYSSTIGIGSVVAYGALRITDDFIRHISLGFEQLPFLVFGIPVILMAQLELTRREIQRPYSSLDSNDPAASN